MGNPSFLDKLIGYTVTVYNFAELGLQEIGDFYENKNALYNGKL